LAAGLLLTLVSCGGSDRPDKDVAPAEWAIYWYLCGSDLESWYGCATEDLAEMLAVTLPENVQVVIQTGGAVQWEREDIVPDQIGRYVYDSDGFRLIEQQPQANMGEADTLADFLRFCTENYPAEKKMALFWNHGGGSVAGAAFDINYSFDSLTINEFRTAFEAVCTPDAAAPPFEVIGFDACLMATVDVASTFRDLGRYLVASEELEPGCGWYYTGWLQALANDPTVDGAALGRAICDSYVTGCEQKGTAEEITLSVTDLAAVDALLGAYNDMGTDALLAVVNDPSFFTLFGRGAFQAESYGGNTEEQGYTNMVDLGHLARNSAHLLSDSSEAVQQALADCVVYKVNGPYRSQSSGLSCFHSYNSDVDNFVEYTGIGCSEAFKYLYGYGISGTVSQAGMDYVHAEGDPALQPPAETDLPDVSVLEDAEIFLTDDGWAELYIGEGMAKAVVSVQFILAQFEEESMINLGWSDTSVSDYEIGLFTDLVDGYWPSIDGYPVHTEVVCQEEGYTLYSVPVLLNGQQCNLRVVYDELWEDYHVLGARKGLTDEGMADKNLIQLQPGDKLTLLYLERELAGSGGFSYRLGNEITVTEETMFYETPLPPGDYGMMFKVFDARGGSALSEVLHFTADEEYIYFY